MSDSAWRVLSCRIAPSIRMISVETSGEDAETVSPDWVAYAVALLEAAEKRIEPPSLSTCS